MGAPKDFRSPPREHFLASRPLARKGPVDMTLTTPAIVWIALTASPTAPDLTVSNVQQVYCSNDLNAWCVSPNVKVFRDHRIPRQTVDPVVRLRAARGEHEPLQLVIQSKRELKGLSLRFTPARASLRWNPVGFIDVAQTSTRRTLGKGAHPDALLKSNTFDIQQEANGLVWITARVPGDAAAGEQRSSVVVQQGDRELLSFQRVFRPAFDRSRSRPESYAVLHGLGRH